MTTFKDYGGEFRERYPRPTADPVSRLAHLLELHEDVGDDVVAIVATRDTYGPGVVTGLTYGDLRALSNRMFPVAPKTHYRFWVAQESGEDIHFRTNNTTAEWWSNLEQDWVLCENVRHTAEFRLVYLEAVEVEDPHGRTS